MTLVSTLVRTIEWGDCDPAQIVFYPNYFKWFDEGSHHLFALAGISHTRMAEEFQALGTPLVEAKATFKAPSLYFDRIEIASQVSQWAEKTFTVSHSITNNGRLAVQGYEIRILATRHPDDPKRLKAVAIPGRFKEFFDQPKRTE